MNQTIKTYIAFGFVAVTSVALAFELTEAGSVVIPENAWHSTRLARFFRCVNATAKRVFEKYPNAMPAWGRKGLQPPCTC